MVCCRRTARGEFTVAIACAPPAACQGSLLPTSVPSKPRSLAHAPCMDACARRGSDRPGSQFISPSSSEPSTEGVRTVAHVYLMMKRAHPPLPSPCPCARLSYPAGSRRQRLGCRPQSAHRRQQNSNGPDASHCSVQRPHWNPRRQCGTRHRVGRPHFQTRRKQYKRPIECRLTHVYRPSATSTETSAGPSLTWEMIRTWIRA